MAGKLIDQKQEIINKFQSLKEKYPQIKFEIGPTNKEHEYLMKEFVFYKKSFENQKYAFCSDLWRVWKLSINNGLYLDATIKINENRFQEIINIMSNKDYDLSVIEENGHLIWNGYIHATNNTKKMTNNILNFYKYFPYISYRQTGPKIYSTFFYKAYGVKLNNNKVFYLNASNIDPYSKNSIFNYNGMRSWTTKKSKNNKNIEYFYNNASKFNNKKFSKLWIIIRWFLKNYQIYLIPIVLFKQIKYKFRFEK